MGRKRELYQDNEPTEDVNVKVTMTATLAGPEGNARPGTVLELPEQDAKEMIANQKARQYDPARDKKNPQGLAKPPANFE